jgi:hypothetical protein
VITTYHRLKRFASVSVSFHRFPSLAIRELGGGCGYGQEAIASRKSSRPVSEISNEASSGVTILSGSSCGEGSIDVSLILSNAMLAIYNRLYISIRCPINPSMTDLVTVSLISSSSTSTSQNCRSASV